ncbi:MAG: lysophospholipid acyltransferase family protein, partial [Gammaproteobacteria bacterium]
MNLSRSIVFYFGLFVSLIVFAPISLVVWPLPYHRRYRIVTLWAHLNVWWLATCCGLRWRVTGTENIPGGPAIIMCKHQSAWETFALQKFFPPHVWVLKRELLWLPLFG